MTDVTSTSALSDISAAEKLQQSNSTGSSKLDKDVFLKLMVTQMKNQNPLDPQDNSEFVAQLAQFSSVEGIDNLNTTMEDFTSSFGSTMSSLASSQALQASSMVGRTVKVETDQSYLSEDGEIAGTIVLPADASAVKMLIANADGELVRQIDLGAMDAGEQEFSWDGCDEQGDHLDEGQYQFAVLATVEGENYQLGTILSANVDSVTVSASGAMSLNVAGVGSVAISDVREIL